MNDGNEWWVMALGLLLLALAAAHTARAAANDVLAPCRDDVQKLCAEVHPGQGRMARCLKSHEDGLSPACRTHLKTMFDHMLEAREACSADAERLCADIKGGHGRIISCLRQHQNELADACKSQMMR